MERQTLSDKNRSTIAILGYIFIYVIGAGAAAVAAYFIMMMYGSVTGTKFPEGIEKSDMYMALVNLLMYVLFVIFGLVLYFKVLKRDTLKIITSWDEFFKFVVFVIAGYFAIIVVSVICNIILELVQANESNNQAALEPLVRNYAYLLFPATIIGAPIIEELVFRKAIIDRFKNVYVALLVSSLSFGFIHCAASLITGDFMDLWNIITYASMGLVFGLVYVLSKRNIMYPILLHAFSNALACLIIFLTI